MGYLSEDIEHSEFGGCLAESLGFKYANEIKLHSTTLSLLESKGIEVSDELALLYEADLKVDAYGNEVGYTKRLEDIKKRNGLCLQQMCMICCRTALRKNDRLM